MSDPVVNRRAVLLGALGAAGLSGCGSPEGTTKENGSAMSVETLTYGENIHQYGTLYRPDGPSRGVVVVIHGGFWRATYDDSLGEPLARDLVGRGWTAWNLEYRRVGNGGGLPETFDDVAAGIDRLSEVDDLDLSTVVTLGHSAGGHLAAWAAARGRFPAWRPEKVPVTAVVAQAGVLDLTTGARTGIGGGAVTAFLGLDPGPAYEQVDPIRQVPLDVPVWCVHGVDDDVVPLSQSADYVTAAQGAGGEAELVEVPGDHFAVIDTESEAWDAIVAILDGVAP